MHTEKEHIDPDVLASMGYERRDINVKGLGKAVVWFFGFAIGSAILGAWTLFGLNIRIGPFDFGGLKPRTTVQELNEQQNRAGRILPQNPNPLLQNNVSAKVDLMTMRQDEDSRLEGTGYVDRAKGVVHIPIERAKDLLAQRGLPNVSSEEAAVSRGTTMKPFESAAPERSGPTGDATTSTPQAPTQRTPAVPAPANSAPSQSAAPGPAAPTVR